MRRLDDFTTYHCTNQPPTTVVLMVCGLPETFRCYRNNIACVVRKGAAWKAITCDFLCQCSAAAKLYHTSCAEGRIVRVEHEGKPPRKAELDGGQEECRQ